MTNKKLISWNVNGVRAIIKKGFLKWLEKENPDILGLQETKAWAEQLGDDILKPNGYHTYWSKPLKKGYSGVAVLSKEKPLSVEYGFGIERFDSEGRVVILEFEKFYFLNIYFPNGGMGDVRLKYKLRFYKAFLDFTDELYKNKKSLIICGDFNTAHKEIDLARPKENEKTSGFMPVERKWIDKFLAWGLVDAFRHFNKEPRNYTWWDYKTRARERNVGWRIDYFMTDKKSISKVKDAYILKDVLGSDHCPVAVKLEI